MEQPRFLDDEEPAREAGKEVPPAAPAPVGAEPMLANPVLLEHDPEGPQALPPHAPIAALPRSPRQVGSGVLLVLALGGLIVCWAVLSTISFIVQEYQLNHLLGIAGGVLTGLCFAAVGFVMGRELWAWRSLGEIDRFRAIMSSPIAEFEAVREASLAWIDLVAGTVPDAAEAKRIVRASSTVEEIRAYLRTHVVTVLDEAVDGSTKRAIFDVGAVTAISPHPAWDGLILIVRSLVLVGRIARIFGVRPGLIATISIVRHVVITAAATSAALSVGGRFFGGIAKATPVVRELTEIAGVGALETARIWGLAKLTAATCNPVPRG